MQSSTDTRIVDVRRPLPTGGVYVRRVFADGHGYEGVVGGGSPEPLPMRFPVSSCGAVLIGRVAGGDEAIESLWDEVWGVQG